MDTEDKLKYKIIREEEVPDEVMAEIKQNISAEDETPLDTTDLIQIVVEVEGREDPLTIVGFKSMLYDKSNGDVAIRMIIAQTLENEQHTDTE